MNRKLTAISLLIIFLLSACNSPTSPTTSASSDGRPRVLAVESFLADIAQNVAGDRLMVETLLPLDVDPHAYQPRPSDAAKFAESTVLILNGAEYEHFIKPILENADGEKLVIEASAGLTSRPSTSQGEQAAADPHFWLDPNLVITYVENIRDGLSSADPAGAETYQANAEAYIRQLQELDAWIKTQVETLSPEERFLVTNHEALGYYADRYGFTIVGTVIPSLSSESAPSAQEMAALVDQIRSSNVMAIFLDAMDNPALADQIAKETKVKVITDLHLESLTPPEGDAPNYIEMMKYNTDIIVKGCKG
jgi:zinc/manganese transport system substrate-binding protein